MPLPLTVSCFSKIQIGFAFWSRLTWVVLDKGPLNGCVCVLLPACYWLSLLFLCFYFLCVLWVCLCVLFYRFYAWNKDIQYTTVQFNILLSVTEVLQEMWVQLTGTIGHIGVTLQISLLACNTATLGKTFLCTCNMWDECFNFILFHFPAVCHFAFSALMLLV